MKPSGDLSAPDPHIPTNAAVWESWRTGRRMPIIIVAGAIVSSAVLILAAITILTRVARLEVTYTPAIAGDVQVTTTRDLPPESVVTDFARMFAYATESWTATQVAQRATDVAAFVDPTQRGALTDTYKALAAVAAKDRQARSIHVLGVRVTRLSADGIHVDVALVRHMFVEQGDKTDHARSERHVVSYTIVLAAITSQNPFGLLVRARTELNAEAWTAKEPAFWLVKPKP